MTDLFTAYPELARWRETIIRMAAEVQEAECLVAHVDERPARRAELSFNMEGTEVSVILVERPPHVIGTCECHPEEQ